MHVFSTIFYWFCKLVNSYWFCNFSVYILVETSSVNNQTNGFNKAQAFPKGKIQCSFKAGLQFTDIKVSVITVGILYRQILSFEGFVRNV